MQTDDDDRAAERGEAGEPTEPIDEWWRTEIKRRLAAVRSGAMETVHSEQVDREMESIIARARGQEARRT